jgi:hypothetical protein
VKPAVYRSLIGIVEEDEMQAKHWMLGAFLLAVVSPVATIESPAFAAEKTPKVRWATYRSRVLGVQVSVPSAWVAKKSPKALGFVTPGPAQERAAVGIMKSAKSSIEEAADQQMRESGASWSKSSSRVAGHRAIKVVGPAKDDPSRKIVQYYIDGPQGAYLVQCMAPAQTWHLYSPLFNSMLARMRFLE